MRVFVIIDRQAFLIGLNVRPVSLVYTKKQINEKNTRFCTEKEERIKNEKRKRKREAKCIECRSLTKNSHRLVNINKKELIPSVLNFFFTYFFFFNLLFALNNRDWTISERLSIRTQNQRYE